MIQENSLNKSISATNAAPSATNSKLDGSVLVLIPVDELQRAALTECLPAVQDIVFRTSVTVTQDDVREAAVILGNPPPIWLRDCEKLQLLQLNSSGAEQYLIPDVLPTSTTLINAAGAYGLAVSEHMLGMLFSLMKKLHFYRDNQAATIWKSEGAVSSIWNARIRVVGLGDIGGSFARRVKALGAYTIGIRRQHVDLPEWLDELHTPDELDKLLPKVDVVALSIPGSSSTQKLMSAERLSLMKVGSYLINIGRGSAVDTDALVEELSSGHLAGAGLDVTDPEPLPPQHPLWQLKSALMTPHVAGGFHLAETKNRIIAIWTDNLTRFFQGQPLKNVLK